MSSWVLGNRWWSSTRSPPPVLAQGLETWVKVHALVDACGSRVPGFHKLAFIFRLSVSHDGRSVPVEGVAGCECCVESLLQIKKGSRTQRQIEGIKTLVYYLTQAYWRRPVAREIKREMMFFLNLLISTMWCDR